MMLLGSSSPTTTRLVASDHDFLATVTGRSEHLQVSHGKKKDMPGSLFLSEKPIALDKCRESDMADDILNGSGIHATRQCGAYQLIAGTARLHGGQLRKNHQEVALNSMV